MDTSEQPRAEDPVPQGPEPARSASRQGKPRGPYKRRKIRSLGKSLRKGLTERQHQTIVGIARGKTQRDAAIEAGYSPISADAKASHLMSRPEAKTALQKLLEKKGLGDERIVSELDRGLTDADIGKDHGEYLDRLITLNGHGGGKGGQSVTPSVQLLQQFNAPIDPDGVKE